MVILTLKIKLLPTQEQIEVLKQTIKQSSIICNKISKIAWDNKTFNQFKLHHLTYHTVRDENPVSSQFLIRCISKVADSYKSKNKIKRVFKAISSVSYDSRIVKYKQDHIDIWCVGGRQKIPFICYNDKYLQYIKGEADLIYKNEKLYLFQCVEVPIEPDIKVEEFIGVDFGLTDIAVTSDGIKHTADFINTYREKRQKIRDSIQSKGTKGCKKLLKRLSGKERATATIINHTISKTIVISAKEKNKGIAIEDLTKIRFTNKRTNKKFRTKLGRWSFYQLRQFLEYKAKINGVKLIVVRPEYTSKTCSQCFYIGNRQNKSFKCDNCGNNIDADINASINIATLGAVVNQPEKSIMCSCSVHY